MTHPAPSIELRRWGSEPHDADALAQAWADPEVQRWTAVPPDPSVAHAARWIAGEAERRERALSFDLVIVDPATPAVVMGEVGLVPVSGQDGWGEIGYWLLPAWRGSGRATAAVATFSGWALGEGPFSRLLARTDIDNPRSGRVVERAGYRRADESGGETVPWILDRAPQPATGPAADPAG